MSAPAPDDAIETVFLEPEAVLYDDRTQGGRAVEPVGFGGVAAPGWADAGGRDRRRTGRAHRCAGWTSCGPTSTRHIAQFAEQHLLAASDDLTAPDGCRFCAGRRADVPFVLARPPDP